MLWWIDVLRCGVMFVILELRGILGVLWSFCILGDIIYRFDKQSVLKRLKIGFFKIGGTKYVMGCWSVMCTLNGGIGYR